MERKVLEDVFTAACNACTAGLNDSSADGKAALVKSAVELLKFSGYTVDFNKSAPAKGVATALRVVGQDLPPEFEDDRRGATG